MSQIDQNIKLFIKSLPSKTFSLLLFDQGNRVVGFAVLDENDETSLATIYNANCKKVKKVERGTNIKEVVNILTKDRLRYIV